MKFKCRDRKVFSHLCIFKGCRGKFAVFGIVDNRRKKHPHIEGRDWDFGCKLLVSLFLSPTRRGSNLNRRLTNHDEYWSSNQDKCQRVSDGSSDNYVNVNTSNFYYLWLSEFQQEQINFKSTGFRLQDVMEATLVRLKNRLGFDRGSPGIRNLVYKF